MATDYHPKPHEDAIRIAELLEKAKQDDDKLIDALIHNITLVKALLAAKDDDDREWYQALLNTAITDYLTVEHDLVTKANDALIAEVGYTVKTAVDDDSFIIHDTRI